MASSNTKPAILIVPGSFFSSDIYDVIVEDSRARGYEALAADLPSASGLPPQEPATMAEDAAHFHGIATSLADDGQEIISVAHSYGGIPGTESAKGLAIADRKAVGSKGGIVRIVYSTSIVPPVGGTAQSAMGSDIMPDFITVEDGFMSHDVERSAPSIFSDSDPAEALEWGQKATSHSAISFTGELTYPAYQFIPVSYIFCGKDLISPPEFQQKSVDFIEKESGAKVDVHYLDSGHCPNASMPDAVTAIIRRIAGEKV